VLQEDAIEFVLEGYDSTFANALRRSVLTDVGTLAINAVDVHVNTSARAPVPPEAGSPGRRRSTPTSTSPTGSACSPS
jgi:hypothetical protein